MFISEFEKVSGARSFLAAAAAKSKGMAVGQGMKGISSGGQQRMMAVEKTFKGSPGSPLSSSGGMSSKKRFLASPTGGNA